MNIDGPFLHDYVHHPSHMFDFLFFRVLYSLLYGHCFFLQIKMDNIKFRKSHETVMFHGD